MKNHNSLGHEQPSGLDVNIHPMHALYVYVDENNKICNNPEIEAASVIILLLSDKYLTISPSEVVGGEGIAIATTPLLATQTSRLTTMAEGKEGISRRSLTKEAIWVSREAGAEEGRGGGEGGGGEEGGGATGDSLLEHPMVVRERKEEVNISRSFSL